MNYETNKRMTLQERTAKHRLSHTRDKVSFGEPKLSKQKKIKKAKEVELTNPNDAQNQTEPVVKLPKTQIKRSQNQLPVNMRRCRICRKTTTAHRVRIGDCHTDRYGEGDYGQTYSGAKGRGKLHGI
jgi:hypothetical protein